MKTPDLTFKKEVKRTDSKERNALDYSNKATSITSFMKLSNLVSLDLKEGKTMKNFMVVSCSLKHQ